MDRPWRSGRRSGLPVLLGIAGLQAVAIAGLSALVPAYLERAGASAFVVGLAFTAWAITRGAFGLVAGRLYARLGSRRLLTFALALFTATTLGYALDHRPLVLVALRLGQGVAAGLFWTSLLAAAAESSPPERRMAALSAVNVMYAAGALTSNVLAGAVAAAAGPAAFFWLEAALLGGIGVPLGLAVRPAATRTPPPAVAEAAAASERPPQLGRHQRLQAVLAAIASLPVVLTAVAAPAFLARAGVGYRAVGTVVAAMVVANIAAQLPASFLAARLGERRLLGLLGGLAALLCTALPFARTPVPLAALMIPLSGILALTMLTWLSWAQSGVPPAAIGSLTGLMRGISDLAAVLAYSAFGVISHHPAPAMAVLAACAAGAGAAALLLPPPDAEARRSS